MKRIVSLFLMMVLSVAAFAVPTEAQVQAEVQRGNYAQAETMMREVVQAKPNSAKAHYIYAEVLAHNARFDQAAAEVNLAKQIDPDIRFTQADKFRAFEQLIDKEQRAAAAGKARSESSSSLTPPVQQHQAVEQRSSGLPGWVWGVGFALIAVMLWRIVSSTRRPANVTPGYPNGGGMPMGGAMPMNSNGMPMQGGMPMGGMPMGQPGGSSMLGTGVAAAGGFAAGMLAEKLFDGHRDAGASNIGSNVSGGNGNGLVPGMFDDSPPYNPAAQELEQRPIDFGTGNDWGGDVSSSDSSDNSNSDDGW